MFIALATVKVYIESEEGQRLGYVLHYDQLTKPNEFTLKQDGIQVGVDSHGTLGTAAKILNPHKNPEVLKFLIPTNIKYDVKLAGNIDACVESCMLLIEFERRLREKFPYGPEPQFTSLPHHKHHI